MPLDVPEVEFTSMYPSGQSVIKNTPSVQILGADSTLRAAHTLERIASRRDVILFGTLALVRGSRAGRACDSANGASSTALDRRRSVLSSVRTNRAWSTLVRAVRVFVRAGRAFAARDADPREAMLSRAARGAPLERIRTHVQKLSICRDSRCRCSGDDREVARCTAREHRGIAAHTLQTWRTRLANILIGVDDVLELRATRPAPLHIVIPFASNAVQDLIAPRTALELVVPIIQHPRSEKQVSAWASTERTEHACAIRAYATLWTCEARCSILLTPVGARIANADRRGRGASHTGKRIRRACQTVGPISSSRFRPIRVERAVHTGFAAHRVLELSSCAQRAFCARSCRALLAKAARTAFLHRGVETITASVGIETRATADQLPVLAFNDPGGLRLSFRHSLASCADQSRRTLLACVGVGVDDVVCATDTRPTLLPIVSEGARRRTQRGVHQGVSVGAALQSIQAVASGSVRPAPDNAAGEGRVPEGTRPSSAHRHGEVVAFVTYAGFNESLAWSVCEGVLLTLNAALECRRADVWSVGVRRAILADNGPDRVLVLSRRAQCARCAVLVSALLANATLGALVQFQGSHAVSEVPGGAVDQRPSPVVIVVDNDLPARTWHGWQHRAVAEANQTRRAWLTGVPVRPQAFCTSCKKSPRAVPDDEFTSMYPSGQLVTLYLSSSSRSQVPTIGPSSPHDSFMVRRSAHTPSEHTPPGGHTLHNTPKSTE
eukprot:1537367-Rhodomonas_salina.2